jgi:DNA-binding transcriptional ArsR family regulator
MKVKEIKSRMGNFCIVEFGEFKLLTPCDTRVKILKSLSEQNMTAEDLSKVSGASYSTVMDHMDLLEKIGAVEAYLDKSGVQNGRRRIYFRLVAQKS